MFMFICVTSNLVEVRNEALKIDKTWFRRVGWMLDIYLGLLVTLLGPLSQYKTELNSAFSFNSSYHRFYKMLETFLRDFPPLCHDRIRSTRPPHSKCSWMD